MSANIQFIYDEDRRYYSNLAFCDKQKESNLKYLLVAEIGECRPISYLTQHGEDVLDFDEQGQPIRIKDCMRMTTSADIHPSFRRQWEEQLGQWLNALMKTDISSIRFIVNAQWYREPILYNGWSYQGMEIGPVIRYDFLAPLIVRWRSLDKNRAYIGMNEPVKGTDIEFDFCFDSEPYPNRRRERQNEAYLRKLIQQSIDAQQATLEAKKRRTLGKPRRFIWTVSRDCHYPDALFTVLFKGAVTPELREQTSSAFLEFMENWNLTEDEAIHDVQDGEEIVVNHKENAVYMFVDFGGCDPRVIQKLMEHLQYSGLPITAIEVS